ncbi:uncharacterized protein BHQ10_004582 [Talaromyces amestolkiae]|uniref:PDZ domain-containing protein n=1 Tax=Talaromyces amestolkiae TaxID=1196081 RepID=A0A364KYD1_TALAM|nr:uncharacterized protein BHQ10_004582 [Talaromyces amestolkiae]RAO68570.1 hypothetical protein BHQ10_004582 [Talaromyces amestolkiae]
MTQISIPPTIDYTITPVYNHVGEVISIKVRVELLVSPLSAGQVLLAVPLQIASVDVGCFVNDSIVAFDAQGLLSLSRDAEKLGPPIAWQKWRVLRDTQGPISAEYEALPRRISTTTRNAPPFDLRLNFGGAISSGYGFLAAPLVEGFDQKFDVFVQWDLSKAPSGTRAIWTFGEGPDRVYRRMPCSEIQATYFAVGKIVSHGSAQFGLYWLGNPPFDARLLSDDLCPIFMHMAKFFGDKEDDPYRVFIRYNIYRGSGAGTALVRSFTFNYDDWDYKDPPSAEQQALFLCHEMTHNWVKLGDPETDNWYAEGLAEYYSLLMPTRTKLLTLEQFRVALNYRLFAYYTNPLVHHSNDEVAKLTWKVTDAQQIPYGRGLLLAFAVDDLISSVSHGRQSLDDLVLSILRRQRNGEPSNQQTYIEELGYLLGDDASSYIKARAMVAHMCAGKPMVPTVHGLARFGLKAERGEGAIWELGFDEAAAMDELIIKNLDPCSAAARAGVHEGDRIIKYTPWSNIKGKQDAMIELFLCRRSGDEIVVSFTPRGSRMMVVWQYVSVN